MACESHLAERWFPPLDRQLWILRAVEHRHQRLRLRRVVALHGWLRVAHFNGAFAREI